MSTKSCPQLTFKITWQSEAHEAARITARAKINDQVVDAGHVFILARDRKNPYVSFIQTRDGLVRCGIGTALYQQAAKLTCREFKAPLQSDAERSQAAHGFWVKQVAKGRAKCLREVPAYDGSKDPYGPREDAITGRGGCERYVLTCPAPKDRSGARRRGRDRSRR
jgi:hypothetical protein